MGENMKIINKPSPNFNDRAQDVKPWIIVIHAIGYSHEKALDTLTDPDPKKNLNAPHGAVSAHYYINMDGTIYKLVDEEKRAWHAGVSTWKGETDINSLSIGIELRNECEEFSKPFTEAQLKSLEHLIADIRTRYDIKDDDIVGHDEIAPERKTDPGPHFPWARFRPHS
jgi:N-acetylmuramoyl-L-alanine amidase